MDRNENGQQKASPVGTVMIRQHRYDTPRAWVKVSTGAWMTRAAKVWQESGGPQPTPGFILHHIDGNSLNDDVRNLALISQAAHPQFHADVTRERQTGMEYETKAVRCTRCKEEYEGCYQRRDSVCRKCRRAHRKEMRKAVYEATGK